MRDESAASAGRHQQFNRVDALLRDSRANGAVYGGIGRGRYRAGGILTKSPGPRAVPSRSRTVRIARPFGDSARGRVAEYNHAEILGVIVRGGSDCHGRTGRGSRRTDSGSANGVRAVVSRGSRGAGKVRR